MSAFFCIVLAVFLFIVILQYWLIRVVLPKTISRAGRTLSAALIAFSINTIPFWYMGRGSILDALPWWHRDLILYPYTIFLVASALSGVVLLIPWSARSFIKRLWPEFKAEKRDFLGNTGRVLLGTSVGLLAYGTYHESKAFEISRVDLAYKGLHPDLTGFKIVQLTDFHAGPLISSETIGEIVSAANALKPDLICLTGDYVNHNPAYIPGCIGLLNDLEAPAGVFGVYGNHDHYTGMAAMRGAFSKTHISMLSDSYGTPKGLGGLFHIIGAEDPVSGWAKDAQFGDLAKISGLIVPQGFNLLLSHRPGIFTTSQDWKAQLTLSGHTHGGQAIVPWLGDKGFSLAGFFVTYTHGLYPSEKDSQVRMYVSRGIGTIVAPVRVFCKPEIVEITLTPA